MPLEIYELVKHFSLAKTGGLLVNAAIVWYLVARLRTHKRERSASATG